MIIYMLDYVTRGDEFVLTEDPIVLIHKVINLNKNLTSFKGMI